MKLLPDSNLFPSGREHYKDWAGLTAGSMAAVLAELARSQDHLFVVLAPNSSRAQQLTDSLSFYLTGSNTPVMLFPDWETLPYDHFSPHQDIVSDRIRVLHQLPTTHKGILVVPVNTLMQRLAPPLHITGNSFLLKVGDVFDMDATRERLVACGYRQRDNVYEHGLTTMSGLPTRKIGEDAMAALQAHDWPGNVRQLRNNVERLLILATGSPDEPVTLDSLPSEVSGRSTSSETGLDAERMIALPLRDARENFEREYLKAQINRFGGNISRTANFIGMERSALHRKLKTLGVASLNRKGDDIDAEDAG